MTDREEFFNRIKETFKIEAQEGIAKISNALIKLEKDPPDSEKQVLIEAVFRESHSLKGASRAVNFSEIEYMCQELESVFSALKSGKFELHQQMFDLLHQAMSTIKILLKNVGEELDEDLKGKVSDLIYKLTVVDSQMVGKEENQNLADISPKSSSYDLPAASEQDESLQDQFHDTSNKDTGIPGRVPEQEENIPKTPRKETSDIPNTIRISTDKIDDLLFQAEEMIGLKHIFNHLNNAILSTSLMIKDSNQKILESADVLGHIKMSIAKDPGNSLGELIRNDVTALESNSDWTLALLKNIGTELNTIRKFILHEGYNNSSRTENLLDEVKKIISVPISTILDIFPVTVRDMASDKGKEADVIIKGGDVEIDRRILEEIRNPILHIIRNCVDHGIEKTEVRTSSGKPRRGTISISTDRIENSMVEISIDDDGKGIDIEKLRQKYIRNEKASKREASELTESVLLDYMFRSGISTSDMITDLSGRGLGLAIVKEKIEQIGGSISVTSSLGEGTWFKIHIPLSMVTFRGVLIEAGNQKFVLPTAKINTVLRIEKSEIKTIENKATVKYNGGIIPLIYLTDILEIPFYNNSDEKNIIVIVLGPPGNQIGFKVKEILEEEVYLSKNFNPQLKRVRNISGATVTGSGKVIPILNISDLLKSASKQTSQRSGIQEPSVEKPKSKVLVVEDSITSRILIKNILETSGYEVSTAIDGVEGYTTMKEISFDLVVSDVDMPRMNGLDLTAKIRSDPAISEIPVILLTSLSKREDRERGMEVGANAYIVKSSFDQSNLLEVIDRLI